MARRNRGVGMTYQEPLSQKAVVISISESDDMAILGLAEEHLRDAMGEVARHLLAMGARLIYGGDLRRDGFTELLVELVVRHRRDADVGDERTGVVSYLPWPIHMSKSGADLRALEPRGQRLRIGARVARIEPSALAGLFPERQLFRAPVPVGDLAL